MAKPVSSVSVSFRDYDGELSNVQVWATDLSAANFDAQATARASFITGLRAISLGEYAQSKAVAATVVASAAKASSPTAQRETKWLVRYHDANGYKFQMEIPCADPSKLGTNSEFMSDANKASFATPFEAFVKSPYDGSAVTLDSLQLVGRRT